MPIIVNEEICTGCEGLKEPKCVMICPGNLIALNEENKIQIKDSEKCWYCMACVKACPNNALKARLPYEIARYKAELTAKISKNAITWEIMDENGEKEIFQFEIRKRDEK